jgi:hypothetical protein
MIKTAIEYIADELIHAIGLDEDEVSMGSISNLKEKSSSKIIISLLNVEEEVSLKNGANHFIDNKKVFFQTPPFSLNLDLIIVFDYEEYSTCLQHLSSVANYLYKKKSFSKERQLDTNPFPESLNKLHLDLKNLSIEQLSQIWSMCGGVHYPALFYKLRLIQLPPDEEVKAKEVQTIEVKPDHISGEKLTQDA